MPDVIVGGSTIPQPPARPTRIYNCIPSLHDPRDYQFVSKLASAGEVILPPSVDLRSQCSPVVDQGNLGSCTANALASGLREFMVLKAGQPLNRLSRLFIYYEERSTEGDISQDAGASMKDGLDCMVNLGVCTEALDPYNIATFTSPPSSAALAEAPDYKINKYMQITSLAAGKACLAQGYPVAMGMNVYAQMESQAAATTGIVACPAYGEQPLGGHAVTIVGYQDTPKFTPGYWKGGGYLIVRNSWSASWGLEGYFKLAYQYVLSNYAWEFWTCR